MSKKNISAMELLIGESSRMQNRGVLDESSDICIADVFSLSVAEEVMYCRLCATLASDAVSIYGEEGLRMRLEDKINVSLPIWVSRNMGPPLHVCRICIENLNATVQFINQVVAAQKKINNVFQVLQDHSEPKAPLIKSKDVSRPAFLTYFRANKFKKLDSMTRLPSVEAEKENEESGKHKARNRIPEKDIDSMNSSIEDKRFRVEKAATAEKILEDIFSLDARQTKGVVQTKEPVMKSRVEDSNAQVCHPSESISLDHVPLVDISDGDDSDSNSLGRNDMADDFDEQMEAQVANSSTSEPIAVSGKSFTAGVPKFDLTSSSGALNNACKYCDKSFKWKTELFFHQRHAHQDVVFTCPVCFKIFYDDKEEFSKHVKAHPKLIKPKEVTNEHMESSYGVQRCSKTSNTVLRNVCRYCEKVFMWNTELVFHEVSAHQDVVFRCPVCFKVFYDDKEVFSKHVKAHSIDPKCMSKETRNEQTETNSGVSSGPIVEKMSVSNTESETSNHENEMSCTTGDSKLDCNSSNKYLEHACKYCESRFRWPSQLLHHEITVHQDVVFRCPVCFKVFYDDKEVFSKHVKAHSIDPKCMSKETRNEQTESNSGVSSGPIVEKISVSNTESETSNHESEMTCTTGDLKLDCKSSNKYLKYACKYCESRFRWPSQLMQHEITVHQDVVFCCRVCCKLFYDDKEEFSKHVISHSMDPELKSKETSSEQTNANLDARCAPKMQNNYGTVPKNSSRVRLNYICKYCSQKFSKLYDLFAHQTVSHPDVAFRCMYCAKVFYEDVEEFKKHVRGHEESKGIKRIRSTASNSNGGVSHGFHSDEQREGIIKIQSDPSGVKSVSPNGNKSTVSPSSAHLSSVDEKVGLSSSVSEDHVSSCDASSEDVTPSTREVEIKVVFQNLGSQSTPKVKPNPQSIVKINQTPKISPCASIPIPWSQIQTKSYFCKSCLIPFKTEEERELHRMYHHKLKLPCRFCPRTLTHKKQLLDHEASHFKRRKNKCRKCGQTFEDELALKQHRRTQCVVQELPRFSCQVCKRLYVREHELKIHLETHLDERPFLCEKCGQCFKDVPSLKEHRRTPCKSKGATRGYNCDICKKNFINARLLAGHRLHFHTVFYPCPFCGLVFKSKVPMTGHMKSHSEIICLVCKKDFGNLDDLQSHRKIEHPEVGMEEFSAFGNTNSTPVRNLKCLVCEKFFASQLTLRVHGDTHSNGLQWKCRLCKERFGSEAELDGHMSSHPGEKPYKCGICDLTFSVHNDLVVHEKIHIQEESHSCEKCGKSFTSTADLVKHYAEHTSSNAFKCPFCVMSFSRKISLLIHQRTHSTRVYSCSVCNEKFSQLKLVKEHEKTHGKNGEDSPVHSHDADEDALAASMLDMSGSVVEVGPADHVFEETLVSTNATSEVQRARVMNSNIVMEPEYSEIVYVTHGIHDLL